MSGSLITRPIEPMIKLTLPTKDFARFLLIAGTPHTDEEDVEMPFGQGILTR